MSSPVPAVATLVRAANPGEMTLDGTNTWVLRVPGEAACVVVDPGPDPADDDGAHLAAVVAAVRSPGSGVPDGAGRAVAVLLTHRHLDHAGGAAALGDALGTPVRAALPELCTPGEAPLADGEVIRAGGLRVVVHATPGHTDDSVSLEVAGPVGGPGKGQGKGPGAVLTGDTVLGEGTTVLMRRDGGSLGDYLTSLDRLETLATPAADGTSAAGHPVVGLPGHGPVIDDLAATVRAYREHRLARLAEVRAALDGALTPGAGAQPSSTAHPLPHPTTRPLDPDDATLVDAVVHRVYGERLARDPRVLRAARESVAVQLAHLAHDDA